MKMLKSFKKFIISGKQKLVPEIELFAIQDQLGNGFFVLLNDTFQNRQLDDENSVKGEEDIDAIIEDYAKKNKTIAAAAALIPGPLGVFSAIPELVITVGNQMKMIYDIGCAYDKESFLNKDVLLEIPIHAFGGSTGLDGLQFQASDLDDSMDDVLKEKALSLGKNMLEKSMKQSLVSCIPIGGSIIMSTWAGMTTNKIANSAVLFFDKNAELSPPTNRPKIAPEKIDLEKIKAFIKLIESDNQINAEQVDFIRPIIENSHVSDEEKERLLLEAQRMDSDVHIDVDLLKQIPEEVDSLLFDLIVLAKRDGVLHEDEKKFISDLASALDAKEGWIQDLLAEPIEIA